MRVLLVTPPMIQLNTPYPATAYLRGFLQQHAAAEGFTVVQDDPALQLFLAVFSQRGLERVAAVAHAVAAAPPASGAAPSPSTRDTAATQDPSGRKLGARVTPAPSAKPKKRSAADAAAPFAPAVANFCAQAERYIATIDATIGFLQGRDPSLALRIVGRSWLPEGPRFAPLRGQPGDETLEWGFGALGVQDRAKHLASLYIDDIADAIKAAVDPRFELSRYGERLAAAANSFAPLAAALDGAPTLIDTMLDEVATALWQTHRPDVLGISVPFPGCVYGGLRIAKTLRALQPGVVVAMGGGYVNTELRSLSDPGIFRFVDYITLDDGEMPLLALLRHLRNPVAPLLRTMRCQAGRVELISDASLQDIPMREVGTPDYEGLPLANYVSMLEMLNPMHRLWSDGRWNKLTVAHGCYWKKCTFCDVSLDYIGRYEPIGADLLVDRICAIIAQTGQTGFHFVDEAAPPAALRALAERLLARNVTITWWGNVRFEKAFTPELCALLARSGCIAVSGGLEAASDRLLALMKKGVTVAQVAGVTRAFTDAGIMVHAYLMYGFPTQTVQETVDSLERVRQLFAEGCLQSAYWHRFAATIHAPVAQAPQLYGIRLASRASTFANNDVDFVDQANVDHDALAPGLRTALYNFMQGLGFDRDVRSWFAPTRVPRAQVDPHLIAKALAAQM